MPSMDCFVCQGSGYVQDDDGATSICAKCDGTGVLFVDEDRGDALSEERGPS